MNRYGVIADDLTGAGDTGVQFARAGLATRVVFGDWEKADLRDVRTLVVNTDSRAHAPADAYEAVRQAAVNLVRLGFRPVYKKVDSTLRGHPGTEIEAIIDAASSRLAVVCPAFPANGRIIVGGHLLVDGVPVERTAVGRDPVTPVRESYLPALLSGETRRDVELVTYRDIAAGEERLLELFGGYTQEGGTIVVCDAISDADLELIASACYTAAPDALFVGSAGLAIPLSRILSREENDGIGGFAPILALVGSLNPAAREQVKLLLADGRWFRVPLTVEDLLSGESAWRAVKAAAFGIRAEAVRKNMNVLILSPGERDDVDAVFRIASSRGIERVAATQLIAGRIAELGAAFMEAGAITGVIATGGDTARALLEKIDVSGLNLHAEVSPGIPVGSIPGGKFAGLRIVTKAGGFGKPEALREAAKVLGTA